MKNITTILLIIALSLSGLDISAATLYARADGDWASGTTWSTSGVGGVSCSCTPANPDSVVIDGFDVNISAANVTTDYILLTNASGNAASLNVSNGQKLSVSSNFDVTAENQNDYVEVHLSDDNTELEVRGNTVFTRTATNAAAARLLLWLENGSEADFQQDFTFSYLASGNESNAEIQLEDESQLTVGGDVLFQLDGGKDITVDINGTAQFTAGGNMTFDQNGGVDIYLNMDDNAVLADSGLFYVDQDGGDDFTITFNGDAGTAATLYAGSFQLDHDGGDDATITFSGSSSLFSVAGNADINWDNGSGDVMLIDLDAGEFSVAGDLSVRRLVNTAEIDFDLDGGNLTTNDLNVTNNGGNSAGESIYFYADDASVITVNGDVNVAHNGGGDVRFILGAVSVASTAMMMVTGNFTLDHNAAGDGNDVFLEAYDNTMILVSEDLNLETDAMEAGGEEMYLQMNDDAQLHVTGDIDMSARENKTLEIELNDDSYLFLGGTITRQAAPNTFGYLDGNDNSTIELNGTDPQVIAATFGNGDDSLLYSNLIINNAYATSPQLSLGGDVRVSGMLNMTDGVVQLGASDLILMDDANTTGGSINSYIDASTVSSGKLVKEYKSASSINMPIGDDDEYSPYYIVIDNSTAFGSDAAMSFTVTDTKHTNAGAGSFLTRYWTLDGSGFSNIKYRFVATYTDADISGIETALKSARWDGSEWFHYDMANDGTNTILSSTNITVIPSNDDFTGGGGGALPIELLSFTAAKYGSDVLVQWTTAVEIDNDFFTLERSSDGISFEEITNMEGAGNSMATVDYEFLDTDPLTGVSYYRLKQIDFDGAFTYSKVVSVSFNSSLTSAVNVYPNPVVSGQSINVSLEGFASDKEVLVVLLDPYGRKVFSKVVIQEDDKVVTAIDNEHKLSPGIYFVVGSSEKEMHYKKLCITSGQNPDALVRK